MRGRRPAFAQGTMRPVTSRLPAWAALVAVVWTCGPAGAAPDEGSAWAWLDVADPRPEASRFAPDLTEEERAIALMEGRRSVAAVALETGDGVPRPERADLGGVVVSADGVVATAWEAVARHAATPKAAFWVRVGDGSFVRAVPVGRTWLADVALLRPIAPATGRPVPWSASPQAAVGRRCVAVGTARGRGNVAAAALCAGLTWADPQAETGRVESRAGAAPRVTSRSAVAAWLRFPEALATKGGEGSPVFDEKGRCVGIVATTDTVSGSLDRVMVRPAALLLPIVERLLKDGGWRAPDPGFALGPPPRGDARFLPPDTTAPVDVRRAREAKQRGGALVASVAETGAANGVVWPGDVVLTIDGHPVFHETPETWIEPLLGLHADVPCTLTLWRGGARATVRVEPGAPAGVDAQARHDADGPRDTRPDPPHPVPRRPR